MIIANGTVANDRVNKYGERLLPDAIFTAYQQQWTDILPYNANHDSTRRIGCTRISGVLIEPGATYLANQVLIPENDSEKKRIDIHLKKSYISRIEKEHGCDFDRLLSLLSDVLSENKKLIYTDSVAIIDNGIVPKLFPELWDTIDDDGLINLSLLTPVLPGIYRYGEFLIYAHPYFRRSLSRFNNLNVPFFACLQEKMPNAKIALDSDMVGLAGTESQYREYAYWWGPKFDDDLTKIPLDVTHFENEHYDPLMSPIINTECGWYIQNKIRTFECEEITDVQNIFDSRDLYGCRYVHSMLSNETNLPCHLDGAIRAYTEEKMLHRLEIKIKQAERDTTYTKLWRIDQQIPVEIWKELITHYYMDNHLLGEYFGGVDARQSACNSEESKLYHKAANPLIPTDLNSGDGIRAFITINDLEKFDDDFSVKFRPYTYTGPQGIPIRAIEYESITLRKQLAALGLSVRTPFCPCHAFNDTVHNLPIMVCSSVAVANTVINAVLDLVKAWNQHQDNRVISFAVKVNYTDYAVTYSFVGHINDFMELSCDFDFAIPEDQNGIIDWSKKLRVCLDRFHTSYLYPPLGCMLSNDNTLVYKRVFLDKSPDSVKFEDNWYIAGLSLPEEQVELMCKETITATVAWDVKNTVCCKCNRAYRQCSCIKYIDPECTDDLTDVDAFGLFFTKRMA